MEKIKAVEILKKFINKEYREYPTNEQLEEIEAVKELLKENEEMMDKIRELEVHLSLKMTYCQILEEKLTQKGE